MTVSTWIKVSLSIGIERTDANLATAWGITANFVRLPCLRWMCSTKSLKRSLLRLMWSGWGRCHENGCLFSQSQPVWTGKTHFKLNLTRRLSLVEMAIPDYAACHPHIPELAQVVLRRHQQSMNKSHHQSLNHSYIWLAEAPKNAVRRCSSRFWEYSE